jgi:hypothetical protein
VNQFNPAQRDEAIALLEHMTWGDMDCYICTLENALQRALKATAVDFQRWEDEVELTMEFEGWDEFTVPETRVEEMSLEEKLAYVARLLRSLALSYGVGAGFGRRGEFLGEAQGISPAALLRGLNDIQWLPTIPSIPRTS